MLPRLTAQLPGTGGTIKETPADFFVEEIPAYLPSGEGSHLYLLIEKQGLTTFSLLQELARQLGVRDRDCGYAGLKDARATTRQWVSVPEVPESAIQSFTLENARVLEHSRHTNKLRPGHLRGNRFRIHIHNTAEEALVRATEILHVLNLTGVPNYFGQQRYGVLANNQDVGRCLLQGNFDQALNQIIGDPQQITHEHWQQAAAAFVAGDLTTAMERLPRRMAEERRLIQDLIRGKSIRQAVLGLPKKRLLLYLNAYQSSVFDRQVAMRLASLDVLWSGDIAYIHSKGACFRVEDPQQEQERVDNFEISPSGFLPGKKVMLAEGQSGILERALLEKEGVAPEQYTALSGLQLQGERRPLRFPLQQASCSTLGDGLQLEFILPAGCFATSVLREVMKTDF